MMDQTQQPLIDDGVLLTSPKKFPLGLIIVGVVLAALTGIGGVFLGKFLFVVKTSLPTTYKECIKAKGSIVEETYPAACVAKDGGQRFVQPLTEGEQVCGGWNTGGKIVCDCSGKLIKPDCPSGVICDGGDYFCQGQCGNCCWQGAGEDVQYSGPYPVCDSDSTKLPDQACELGAEYESNAVDGPDCQCPVGFQPEIVDIDWGPCPGDGKITDCPSSRFKCSKEKATSGAEGK